MGHIKRFNEDADDQLDGRSDQLEFLDEFIESLSGLRDRLSSGGEIKHTDANYIADVYGTYGKDRWWSKFK